MPGMPPPASDEHQTLLEFLKFNQNAFFAVAYGLTDEQARSTPSVSALSIGGLLKHAAGVKGWAQRAAIPHPTFRRGMSARWKRSWRSTRDRSRCVTTKPSSNCSTS